MPEYSRILIEEYCMSHSKTKKATFLWDMVQKSYDIAYEPEDCELLYLEPKIPLKLYTGESNHQFV